MSGLPRVLASLALVAGLSGPAGAATVLHWSEVRDPGDPAVQMIGRIAKRLAETSQGRVSIQASPSEEPGLDRLEKVAAGTLPLTTVNPAPVRTVVPGFGVIEAPYVWRDLAHLRTVMSGPLGQELSRELIDKRGVRVLGTMYYGARHVIVNRPVRAVADMKGVRLRVPQNAVYGEMARAWDAKPVNAALGTVRTMVRRKLVDGQENFLATIESSKLFEGLKHLVLTGHVLLPRLVLINEKAWQALGPADQKALADAVAEGIAWQDQEVQAREKALLDRLKQAGLEIIQPDVESLRKPVVAAMPKAFDGRWGAGLYQRIVDTK
jgi:tripartite ATP-independent transporter DctP family solute receptor